MNLRPLACEASALPLSYAPRFYLRKRTAEALHTAPPAQKDAAPDPGAEARTVERSTVQRIGDVEAMVTSFRQHLRAENKADQTVTAYTYAPLQLVEFLRERGMPTEVANIRREHVEAFLEDLLGRRSAATANNPFRGLVAFFGWLEEEVEIPSSPMARMKPPTIPAQPVPIPSTRDIQAILMAKGALASAQIEGNTLTEEQALSLPGDQPIDLPPSGTISAKKSRTSSMPSTRSLLS